MISEFEIKDRILIKYHGKDPYVMIPDGITRIGEYAFCDREHVCTGNMKIKGVYLPEGVVSVGHSAFRNCYQLEIVSLPESLVRIESFAFRNTCIRELVFPDNLRHVNDDAFHYYHVRKISYLGVTFSPKKSSYPYYFSVSGLMKSLRTDKVPAMEMLLQTGQEQAVIDSFDKFITRANIDRLIKTAIAYQAHELQLILTDYKYQHFRFQNPADKLKL